MATLPSGMLQSGGTMNSSFRPVGFTHGSVSINYLSFSTEMHPTQYKGARQDCPLM